MKTGADQRRCQTDVVIWCGLVAWWLVGRIVLVSPSLSLCCQITHTKLHFGQPSNRPTDHRSPFSDFRSDVTATAPAPYLGPSEPAHPYLDPPSPSDSPCSLFCFAFLSSLSSVQRAADDPMPTIIVEVHSQPLIRPLSRRADVTFRIRARETLMAKYGRTRSPNRNHVEMRSTVVRGSSVYWERRWSRGVAVMAPGVFRVGSAEMKRGSIFNSGTLSGQESTRPQTI